MNYKTALTSLLLAICLPIFSQIDTIKLTSLSLKGNIKEFTSKTFIAKDSLGIVICGEFIYEYKKYNFKTESLYKYPNNINSYYQFDNNGNLTDIGQFNSLGYLYDMKKYIYANRQISECNEIMTFSDMEIYIKELYKYNNNKLKSVTSYQNGELFNKKVFKYDLSDHIIEEKILNNEGKTTDITIRRFVNNNLVYEKNINDDRTTESKNCYDIVGNKIYSFYRYDNTIFETKTNYLNKLPIQKINLRNGKLNSIQSNKYIYDQSLNLSTKEPKKDSTTHFDEITYITNNKINKIVQEKDGNKSMEKYFDKNNNIIKLLIFTNQTKFDEYTYEYTYDHHENITKIIEFKNSIPIKIRQITISYWQ